jgi:surfactin synthase thioesterase subunit
MRPTKGIILPGMGADSRMYNHHAYERLVNIRFLNWPTYQGETSIPQLASRIITEYSLEGDAIIGGSSLGGMVACEIAKQISVRHLLLIGSTNTPARVNPLLLKMSTLSDLVPLQTLQYVSGKLPSSTNKNVYMMFQEADPSFIRMMCKAVFEWEGNSKLDCPVSAIHGLDDHVISPPSDTETKLLPAGHLLAITHPNEVAAFIEEAIR